MSQIRIAELLVIANAGLLAIVISVRLMLEAAARLDLTLISINNWNYFVWTLIIFVYGVFMPNTPQRLIGQGGMGQVFEAEHLLLKRSCAIKLIQPDRAMDDRALRKFEREVRATAKLTHPHPIEIYDDGQTKDGVFFSTEFSTLWRNHILWSVLSGRILRS